MINNFFELAGFIFESTINIGEIIGAIMDSNNKANKNIQDKVSNSTSAAAGLSNLAKYDASLQQETSKINIHFDEKRPSQQCNLTYAEKIDQIIEQVNRFKANQHNYVNLQQSAALINKMLDIKAKYVAKLNTKHDLYIMEQTIDRIYDNIF